MKNDTKTPPLKLCAHGSREAYRQQLAIERRMTCRELAQRMSRGN